MRELALNNALNTAARHLEWCEVWLGGGRGGRGGLVVEEQLYVRNMRTEADRASATKTERVHTLLTNR